VGGVWDFDVADGGDGGEDVLGGEEFVLVAVELGDGGHGSGVGEGSPLGGEAVDEGGFFADGGDESGGAEGDEGGGGEGSEGLEGEPFGEAEVAAIPGERPAVEEACEEDDSFDGMAPGLPGGLEGAVGDGQIGDSAGGVEEGFGEEEAA